MVPMIDLSDAVIALALITVTSGLLLLLTQFSQQRLPPGPRPWPIIGNLLLMRGKSVVEVSKQLIATYGPITTLWIGTTPIVIVSSPELVHSVFHKQGAKVVGRARMQSMAIVSNNFRGLFSCTGDRWKFLRRLATFEVMSNARLAAFKPIREREIDMLVNELRRNAEGRSSAVVSVKYEIRFIFFNILMDIIFKQTVEREIFERVDGSLAARFKLAAGQVRDYVPLLRCLPNRKNIEFQKQHVQMMNELLNPFIEERRKLICAPLGTEPLTCYVDHLLDAQSRYKPDSNDEVPEITNPDIISHAVELLNAGIDTTTTVLEYALANLIICPEMQEKLFNEIDGVVGRDCLVNDSHTPNLPYLQAVVNECLRRHPPGHIMPLRTVTSPGCVVAGYHIPVNTRITAHIETISSNDGIWKNPGQFDPERFYSGGQLADLTGSSQVVTMIPFGIGRRICPAINVALLHIQLILARLIHTFQWQSEITGQLPDVTPSLAAASSPMEHPLRARIMLRTREQCSGNLP